MSPACSEEVYGGRIGRLTVVLEGAELTTLERAAQTLQPPLESLDDVDRVGLKRPDAFFGTYRLLYADYDSLETVHRRLERRIRWDKQRANPLCVDVSDKEPPAIQVEDLIEQQDTTRTSDYYVDEAGERLVVFLHPTFSASDLGRTRHLTRRVDQLVTSQLETHHPSVQFGLTGRYKKRVDLQELLSTDLAWATTLAAALIAALLLLALGSPIGVLIVVLPLIVGLVWTSAWAEMAFDSLNILTGFLGAVLLGLGIDYGLHLYIRYHAHRETLEVDEALRRTFLSSGRANLLAGLTTMVPMATLLISTFQAFYEFGAIALGGLVAILIAYGLIFPVSICMLERAGITLRPPPVITWLEGGEESSPLSCLPRLRRKAIVAVIMLVMLGGIAGWGFPRVQFVRDLHVLQSTDAPSWELDEMVNDMLGRSQTPALVPTRSPEHSRRVIEAIEKRKDRSPHGEVIGEVLSLPRLMPDRPSDKLELLRDLASEFEALPSSAQTDELAEYREKIERTIRAAPLETDDLPETIRAPFQRRDDPSASIVLVFPAADMTDMEHVEHYIELLRELPDVEHERGYDALSESALLYDIVHYVERDARWMLALTLLGLLVVSLLAFCRLRDTSVQFVVLGLGLACAIGWLGAVGVHFNFLNIIVLPIWLGLGIDATFHMLFGLRESPHALHLHAATGWAVALAFMTTLTGFSSMLVARHAGLYSLGACAAWGLGLMMVVHLLAYLILVAIVSSTKPSSSNAPPDSQED